MRPTPTGSFVVANLAGFSTTIVDNRENFANRERFPEAAEIYAEEYEEVFAKRPVNETSYLMVVTRGHRDDMRVLRWAVSTNARYIAMIGSKRKVINVIEELEKEGIARESFARVFAPMGLEIGGGRISRAPPQIERIIYPGASLPRLAGQRVDGGRGAEGSSR